jgi:hypothetical protein
MVPILIAGHLHFPPGAHERWLSEPLDASSFDDWPPEAPLFRGESAGEIATAKDLLAAVGALDGKPSFFEIEDGTVRGFLAPDQTQRLHQDLATAIRAAGRAGATGKVAFLVMGENVGLRVEVGPAEEKRPKRGKKGKAPEEAALQWMPAKSLFADEALARVVVSTMQFVQAFQRDTSLTRASYRVAQESLGLRPLDEQPEHREILSALRDAAPERVLAAMLEAAVLARDDVPLAKRYPTADALAAALAKAEPAARAAGIEILGVLDPSRAEPLAIKLIGDPSPQARLHALRALAKIPTATALDALLAADPEAVEAGDPLVGPALVEASVASRAPGADERIAALEKHDALRGESWASLDRVKDARARASLARRARHAIDVLARRPAVGPSRVLAALFDDHPAEEVRVAAAQALARVGGPEVEARMQPLQFTLMGGMGKALNQDDARRRSLLGIRDEDDSGGILRFGGLKVQTLETLLAERFIHPEARQNDAPRTIDFLHVMKQHPEVEASGYAVVRTRADYRVHIDGVSCDLSKVPAERQEALKALVQQLAESATNHDESGDVHELWWT